jgi:hypothetical protein
MKPADGAAAPLKLADRACCCPARPLFTVVMPPTSARPHPVDLLLCGHHYRACKAVLTAAAATVYDETGALAEPAAAVAGRRTPSLPRSRRRRGDEPPNCPHVSGPPA